MIKGALEFKKDKQTNEIRLGKIMEMRVTVQKGDESFSSASITVVDTNGKETVLGDATEKKAIMDLLDRLDLSPKENAIIEEEGGTQILLFGPPIK